MPIPTELLVRLTGRLVPEDEAAAAAAALRVWEALFGRFVPLLGPLSNELLFARSVLLRQAVFPWLPHLEPGAEHTAYSSFRSGLGSRPAEDILAVNRALLETYTSALADLIGEQLATRLLRTVFPDDDANNNNVEKTA